MKTKTIEIRVCCYECSPHQFEDALNKLDESFKAYDTDALDCVQCPDFNPGGYSTVEVLNIPDDKMDWADEQINEAMLDIPAWEIE